MKQLDTKTLKTVSGGTFCSPCPPVKNDCNPCGSKKSGKC